MGKVNTMNNLTFNMGNEWTPIRERSANAFRKQDMSQFVNRYDVQGMPDYLPWFAVERMLYFRHKLVGYFYGEKLILLPYSIVGGYNMYGLPVTVQPIAFTGMSNQNGRKFPSVNINYEPDTKHGGGIILYDSTSYYGDSDISMVAINEAFINLEALIISQIASNTKASTEKTVFYCDSQAQKRQFEQSLQNCYNTESPFIVVVRDLADNNGLANTPFHNSVDLKTQELFEAWQSVNNIRLSNMGINNGQAFQKKERVIGAEMEAQNASTDPIYQDGLAMRLLWLDQMRRAYPEHKDVLDKISINAVMTTPDMTPNDEESNKNEVTEDGTSD